jgi:iron-sulfur cluster repair protein YtfE (RIC family)
MDVYQILIQDHQMIAKMFEQTADTSNVEAERRKQLFSDLWTALENHELTEENDFFPELVEASSFSPEAGKNAATKELIAELFDDHSDFEGIFQQISHLSTASDEWLERVNELGDLVREHARKEEDELFPAARRELDQTRGEEIGRQIQERRMIQPDARRDQESGL